LSLKGAKVEQNTECKTLRGGHDADAEFAQRKHAADQQLGLEPRQGRPVPVDPIEPKLKPTGNERLKLECGYTAFNFCFQIRYAPLKQGGPGGVRLVRPVHPRHHLHAPQQSLIPLTWILILIGGFIRSSHLPIPTLRFFCYELGPLFTSSPLCCGLHGLVDS
jgi:hypothetical protein